MNFSKTRSRDSWSTVHSAHSSDTESPHNQQALHEPAKPGVERVPSIDSGAGSWINRVRWMKTKKNSVEGDGVFHAYDGDRDNSITPYVDMESETGPPSRMEQAPKLSRMPSHFTKDSVDDFHESEWTPPDSSYGAAIPVAGWIPKHIRRTIEWTLIGFCVLVLAFIIVTTSIRVSEDANALRNRTSSDIDGVTGYDDKLYYDDEAEDDNVKTDDFFDDYYTTDDDYSYYGGDQYSYNNANYGYNANNNYQYGNNGYNNYYQYGNNANGYQYGNVDDYYNV